MTSKTTTLTPERATSQFGGGRLSTSIALAAMSVAMWLLSDDARAGNYTVRQCNSGLAISTSGFEWRAFGSPVAAPHPNSGCSEFGLAARSSNFGAAQIYPKGGYGGYYAVAPEDTAFVRFSGYFGTFGTCCITGMEPHAQVSEQADGSGLRSELFRGSLGNASWQSPSGSTGPISLNWQANDVGFSAKRIGYGLACHDAADCPQSATGELRVRGRSFEFGLNDLSAPKIGNPAGDLSQDEWLRGIRDLEISADDQGGGITELSASLDDGTLLSSPSGCAKTAGYYTELQPCPLERTTGWEIDTRNLADGPHTGEVVVTDVGSTRVETALSFKVDNSAPAIPSTTWVEDGEVWRSINDFVVRWSETGEFAPITRVHYELCSAQEECIVASRIADDGTSLHLDVPEPGAYKVRFWREDGAGNVDSDAKSPAVMLKFDDEAPGQAHLGSESAWLGARRADHYEQALRLADGHDAPVSGIAGYSITTDGSEPDGTVEVYGTSPNYPMEDLLEGATVVKARAVSGAGVLSDAVASTIIKVDRTPPTASVQKEGAIEGWQREPVTIRISGTDQSLLSGMGAAPATAPAAEGGHLAFQLDDGEMRAARGAYVPVTVADDGHHTLSYYAVDAAGNPSDKKSVAFKIDQTPPMGAFRPLDAADPQQLVVSVSDATSGVEGGWVEYRREGVEGFTRLPTRVDGDRMAARIDDSALTPGRYEFRAVVRDVAGNQVVVGRRADGSAMELGLPVRELTRLQVGAEGKAKSCAKVKRRGAAKRRRSKAKRKARAKCRSSRRRAGGSSLRLAPGKRAKLIGRLTKGHDSHVANVDVPVEAQLRSGGPFKRLGTARADGQGRIRFVIPPGPSRTVRFRYDGNSTLRPSNADVLTRVRAAVRLAVNRRRLVNGQSVRFRGRLPGKPIPAGGKLVALQARVGREWRTFATPRANARGAFRHRYRFTATTGLRRYAFRALVAREAAYPYETGTSRKVYVIVRGR